MGYWFISVSGPIDIVRYASYQYIWSHLILENISDRFQVCKKYTGIPILISIGQNDSGGIPSGELGWVHKGYSSSHGGLFWPLVNFQSPNHLHDKHFRFYETV